MKIWMRIGRANLTNGGRSVYGIPISYDEVIEAFNLHGIECISEYPEGDNISTRQFIPSNLDDYMTMWYGDPLLWDIKRPYEHGVVGYTQCMEINLNQGFIDSMNKCDAIFVASEIAKQSFKNQLSVPVYKIFGGYKPSQFYYIERDFQISPFVFLHVGATDWRKGSAEACVAFAKAFKNEDVELHIISPGATPMFNALETVFRYEKRIKFIDKVVSDRMAMIDEYYREGHCLVYPSLGEGWGRCLPEAMATGLPAIVSRVSAMLETFNPDAGWWVDMQTETNNGCFSVDVNDLADKMYEAYHSRDRLPGMATFAASYAKEHLTWDKGIEEAKPILERIYNGDN